MSKKIKYLALTLVVAGGAFGAARILNVDTSFLTGNMFKNFDVANKALIGNTTQRKSNNTTQRKSNNTTKRTSSKTTQDQTSTMMSRSKIFEKVAKTVPAPAVVKKKNEANKNITQNNIAVNQEKIDAVKNLVGTNADIEQLRQIANSITNTPKLSVEIVPIQPGESSRSAQSRRSGQSLANRRTQANTVLTQEELVDQLSNPAVVAAVQEAQEAQEAQNNLVDTPSPITRNLYSYNFYQAPSLIMMQPQESAGPPLPCIPGVSKQTDGRSHFEISEGLYLNVGGCDQEVVEIEFNHRFDKLETEGEVLRFADADATKSYKITYLGDNQYKVQYLSGDDAWEQTQTVNPLNAITALVSLSRYGADYRVGLFEVDNQLVVVSFKML